MSLLSRLLTCTTPVYKTLLNKNISVLYVAKMRPIVLSQIHRHRTEIRIKATKSDECEPGLLEHDKYNKQLGRPLSPHLSIYKKQLTALLSFGHRLSGLAMTSYVYTVCVGSWLWTDINSFFDYLAGMDEIIGETYWLWAHNAVKLCVVLPYIFHTFNAVRHLGWDFGRFLSIKQVYMTGYIMQVLVLITAFSLVFLI